MAAAGTYTLSISGRVSIAGSSQLDMTTFLFGPDQDGAGHLVPHGGPHYTTNPADFSLTSTAAAPSAKNVQGMFDVNSCSGDSGKRPCTFQGTWKICASGSSCN